MSRVKKAKKPARKASPAAGGQDVRLQRQHDTHIAAMKAHWIILSVLFLGTVTFVSWMISDTYDITEKRAQREVAYLRYEFEIRSDSTINSSAATQDNSSANSLPVLLYHGFPELEDEELGSISSRQFKEQMFALKRAGYQTITLEEADQFLHGNLTLPKRSILITFDDGAVSSFQRADPVLKVLGYNAVMFVLSKYSYEQGGSVYYLSPRELELMDGSGRWELQAHGRDAHDEMVVAENGTMGHFLSNKIWLLQENRSETDEEYVRRIDSEFSTVKKTLDDRIGKDVYAFAFPYGDFGPGTLNHNQSTDVILDAVRSRFEMAFFQHAYLKPFHTNYPIEDSFMVKRILVQSDWTGDDLVAYLESCEDKELPYHDSFGKNDGWFGNTNMTFGEGLYSGGVSDTSTLMLDGTYLWENYSFSVNLSTFNGTSIGLLMNFKNLDNHVGCVFYKNRVMAVSVVDEKYEILAEADFIETPLNSTGALDGGWVSLDNSILGGKLDQGEIQCSHNSTVLLTAPLAEDSRRSGGVAIKAWSKEGVPSIRITGVEARSLAEPEK